MSAQMDPHEKLLEELGLVLEKEQNPFNATGPRGGSTIGGANLPSFKSTTRSKTGDWSCRCANYQCQCKGPGNTTKRFNVDPSYKADYNDEYTRAYGDWRRKKKKKKKAA